ncbi:MAG: GAF domain-containing protein [Anaerolineae bacterium]
MSVGTAQGLRFLQQENARLKEENARLQAENDNLNKYLQAIQELYHKGHTITSETDLLGLIDTILYDALTLLDADDGSLMLRDDDTGQLVFILVHGDMEHKLRDYRIQEGEGIAGWVAQHRKPLIVNNPRFDRRFSPRIDAKFGFQTRSIVAVPLLANDKVIGVIELVNKRDGGLFTDNDLILSSILAFTAAAALESVRLRLEAAETAA